MSLIGGFSSSLKRMHCLLNEIKNPFIGKSTCQSQVISRAYIGIKRPDQKVKTPH